MRLADSIETMKIDMVQTAQGCPEACLHCGAYDGKFRKEDLKISEVSPEQLKANLTKIIQGTKFQLADLLASVVTSDVNTEPLRGEALINLAILVEELTKDRPKEFGGPSRVVCISHGLRIGTTGKPITKMQKNLEKIVELMMNVEPGVRDIPTIPVFVLSVDTARDRGKIEYDQNYESYLATMRALRPALSSPQARVTISIQGVDDSTSDLYKGNAELIFQKVLNELDLTPEERARLNFDTGRVYAKTGRAKEFLGSLTEGTCSVIPDAALVKKLPVTKMYRGRVDRSGDVYRQFNHPDRTYNDTVSGEWEFLENNEDGGSGNRFPKEDKPVSNGSDTASDIKDAQSQAQTALAALDDGGARGAKKSTVKKKAA